MNETKTPTWQELFEVITEKMPRRLKFLRDIHNYSQEYLAENLGISQTSYGNLERGNVPITLDKVGKIAETYKLSIDEFFEFDITHIIKKNGLKL